MGRRDGFVIEKRQPNLLKNKDEDEGIFVRNKCHVTCTWHFLTFQLTDDPKCITLETLGTQSASKKTLGTISAKQANCGYL